MSKFLAKLGFSYFFEIIQVNNLLLYLINRVNGKNSIRIVNYHDTPEQDANNFDRQLRWYSRHFTNASMDSMNKLISTGEWESSKPGIMITFDDGFKSNFSVAKELLEKNGFRGIFFVSADLVGLPGYMNWEDLKNLEENGHVIGSHTSTHHRMNEDDSEECLNYEICQSRQKIEKKLNHDIDSFCWCGGEEKHYTRRAFEMIRSTGYKYSFLTNSALVLFGTSRYLLERINIESDWPLSLVKFQLSGIQDLRFRKKRSRVEKLLEN